MPAKRTKSHDYKSLNSSAKNGGIDSGDPKFSKQKSLTNPRKETPAIDPPASDTDKHAVAIKAEKQNGAKPQKELTFAEEKKQKKQEKRAQKDRDLLESDYWLKRNGHILSYVGLYLFSVIVLFRPYELIPGLGFLSSSAFVIAIVTLIVFVPTQFSTEGSFTTLSTEVKCILAMTFIAVLTMPIAKDPKTAWSTFNDTFIKAVLMFIVMVNVLRTRGRLNGLMWLSLAVGVYLSFIAIDMFASGELNTEGYRVAVEHKGLFGNPNDLALHLVTMTPIAFCLGLASKNKLARWTFFLMTALFIGANTVTYSRGGFLGLLAAVGVLIWKLARKNRLNVSLAAIVFGGLFVLLAPGNYGMRILSIFGLAADPVGSSDQRRDLLIRSLIVTARNPWGIGIGNFPIVGYHNLVTHNAYTQISSELGLLGLAAYLIFMISPFRKLGAIERTLFAKDKHDWFYYLAIGLQASIVGFMVSSFFVSVAYNWFIYYLIAYAVAFRRIYRIENNLTEEVKSKPLWEWKTA